MTKPLLPQTEQDRLLALADELASVRRTLLAHVGKATINILDRAEAALRAAAQLGTPVAWLCTDDRVYIKGIVTTNAETVDAWREGNIQFEPLGVIAAQSSAPPFASSQNNAGSDPAERPGYGGADPHPAGAREAIARDAARYRRLQILGCAPAYTGHLERGEVMRFSNLDGFVDADIAAVPSRGEADAILSALPGPAPDAGVREVLEKALAFIDTALVADENPTISKRALLKIVRAALSQPTTGERG